MTGADYLREHGVDLDVAAEDGVEFSDTDVRYRQVDAGGEVFFRTRYLDGKYAGQTRGPGGRKLTLSWIGDRCGGAVLLAEGEVDGHSARSALRRAPSPLPAILDGLVVVTAPGASMPADRAAEELRDAGAELVYIAFDADDPGRKGARRIAKALAEIGITTLIVDLPEGNDLSDEMVAAERPSARLAELLSQHSTRWAREEEPEAKAPEPVDQGPPPDTGELLDAIATTLRRFVVLSDAQRDAVALWTVHAHAIDAADTTPYLDISSPEKQSGKSRLLETLAQFTPRAMEAANVSDAALFRALAGDGGPATLLYDEVDTLFGKGASTTKEEQRGLLNAGYRRGAVAWRCEGDGSKQTVTPYPVFGAKALAGIGDLPETLADRSIPIRLRRRRPDEQVERGRYKTIVAACEPLKREAARWAAFNLDKLREAEPELPDPLSDRAQDGAEPLLAIADLAGGEWPRRARAALVALYSDKAEASESWGVRLLADIRRAFGEQSVIGTVDLIEQLKSDDEAPWQGWGKTGTGLTPRALADLLRPYGIRRKDVRDGEWHGKGYDRRQFRDAWDRYLSSDSALSGDNGDNGSLEPKNEGSLSVTDEELSPIENGRKPHGKANVTDVTDWDTIGRPQAATPVEEAEAERIAAEMGVEV